MATFLKYHNGLLIPVQEQESNGFLSCLTAPSETSRETTAEQNVRRNQPGKVKNLLLVSAFIINTLLTLALVLGS